ncbi:MAG: hypothetical protein K6F92_01560 [Lachnospiraceae bacterium]|nr:hypothetical protein [Lachnospiraceae bacterium]
MKAKLGIHVGFFACIVFLLAMFGGLTPLLLVAGYVLICEDNDFLRMSAIKALLIVIFVALLNYLIGVIPDILFDLFDWFSRIFNAETSFNSLGAILKINQIFNFIHWIVNTCEEVFLLLLAFLACGIKTVPVPFVEKLIEKYASKEQAA